MLSFNICLHSNVDYGAPKPCEDRDKNGVCDVEEEVVNTVTQRCADKDKNGVCDSEEEGEEQVW